MEQKRALVLELEDKAGLKRRMLKKLGIPRSSYYRWRHGLQQKGPGSLKRQRKRGKSWNGLRISEEKWILTQAERHPEESARLLSFRITDSGRFSVSEATVFRVLKKNHMIRPRPEEERPAAKEWHTKTTAPCQLFQSDASEFFLPVWGKFKWIQVMDDYSRKVLAHRVHDDEGTEAVSDVAQRAMEAVGLKAWPEDKPKPLFLSDNGAGYRSGDFKKVLRELGLKPIHGRARHPQTQGKSERLNRRIKEKVNQLVYPSPGALQKALNEAIRRYNETPHEALKNVSPEDMYEGRQKEVLARRERLKSWTLMERRRANRVFATREN